MIEGESIILSAGALCAAGYFSFYKVLLFTFLGTLFADQGIYFLGRYYGPNTLHYLRKRFPKLHHPMDQGLNFLHRHETIYILTFRFIWGIRIISPFIIGAQKVPFFRFSVLNLIAACIWTLISCSAGYSIGSFLGKVTSHIEWWILGMVFLMVTVSIFFQWKKK